MPDYEILIRKGWVFWQGELRKVEGIAVAVHTYRSFTRQGIIKKMNRVKSRKLSVKEWETITT